MHMTFECSAPFEVRELIAQTQLLEKECPRTCRKRSSLQLVPKQARSNGRMTDSWMVWSTKKRHNTQKTITKKAGSVDMWCYLLASI
jgi:hypothetical protein